MLKKNRALIAVGLILAVLMGMVYLRFNQEDYYRRTLLPQDYTDGASDTLFFEKGAYTVTFHYTYAPDAELRIVRGLTADADNWLPALLQAVPLSETGQSVVALAFDQTVYDIQFVYPAGVELGFTDILSDTPVWSDTALTLLLIAGVALYALLVFLREPKRGTNGQLAEAGLTETTVRLLFIAVALFASLPLMREFLVRGQDLPFHLMRIENLKDGLLDGQFPVQIGPRYANGLGYTTSIVYPDLFLYLPAVFRLCGVSIPVSYLAFLFLIHLATLLVTWHAVRRLTGRDTVAVIVSIVYTLCVYRISCTYIRAAVGEVLALIFYPCVMLGMAEALHEGKVSKWLIAGMTGLIQTHVISVEIAVIACALYTLLCVVFRKTTFQSLLRLAAAAGITVLLNLWFLVPFLRFSMEDLRMFGFNSRTPLHAAYPAQLFASFVEPFGEAAYLGTTAEMPSSAGLLLGVSVFLFLLNNDKEDKRLLTLNRVSMGFAFLMLLICTTLFPWAYVAKIPVLNQLLFAVQFPWRFLGLASFLLAMAFGISAYGLGRGSRKLLLVACLVLAALNIAPYMDQFVQSDRQDVLTAQKYDVADIEGYLLMDYFYADTDYSAFLHYPIRITAPDTVSITEFSKQGTHLSFRYSTDTAQTVTLPLYRYPGYTALRNGEAAPILDGDNHLMALSLPAGEGTVAVRYEGFWFYRAANGISALTLIAWIGWAAYRKRKPRKIAA